jgi:26S proteasome regulatory subunit N10
MEEEQARQAASQAQLPPPAPVANSTTLNSAVGGTETIPADPTDDEEEAMLKQALAMSEEQDVDMSDGVREDEEEMSEEEAISRAIEMSMKQDEEGEKKES